MSKSATHNASHKMKLFAPSPHLKFVSVLFSSRDHPTSPHWSYLRHSPRHDYPTKNKPRHQETSSATPRLFQSPCPDCTMFNYRDGADQAAQAQSGAAGGQGNKRPRTAAMYQRKRAVTACQSCRLRKTKCDNVRPACGFCSNNGAQCIYPGPETSDYSTSVFRSLIGSGYILLILLTQFRPGQLDHPGSPQPCCHTLGVSTSSSHRPAFRYFTTSLGEFHLCEFSSFCCSFC